MTSDQPKDIAMTPSMKAVIEVLRNAQSGLEQILAAIAGRNDKAGFPHDNAINAVAEIKALSEQLEASPHEIVPVKPSPGLLASMAMRVDHGLFAPADRVYRSEAERERAIEVALTDMGRVYEEVVGTGFYRKENEGRYASGHRPFNSISKFDDPSTEHDKELEARAAEAAKKAQFDQKVSRAEYKIRRVQSARENYRRDRRPSLHAEFVNSESDLQDAIMEIAPELIANWRRGEAMSEGLQYLFGKVSFGGVPTIRDLCFKAFMNAKFGKNPDDGGPCDFLSDTLPIVELGIKQMAERLDI